MLSQALSYASRPSRIFIRSDDAIDRAGSGTPSNFVLPLIENVLDCKAVQLLSCRIPNDIPQVPNYQRYFIYRVGTSYRAFMLDHNVGYSQRYYADFTALVAQLNVDSAYWIPFTGTPLKRSDFLAAVAQTPDVTFSYDSATRKIAMNNVTIASTITLGSEQDFVYIISSQEVVKPYLYLNFLLGYETRRSFISQFPPLTPASTYYPLGWANLVGTQTIYIVSNLVMNGTYTSDGLRNVLEAVPVANTPILDIITYQSSQRHYIYSVPSTIGTITIQLLDENGQQIYLPENSQVELTIGCVYEGEI